MIKGNSIDRFVGFFFPERGMRRQYFRTQLARSAKYAAAKSTRLTGNWSPLDSNVNTIIQASSGAVRARVRQLVRDFPYFARAVNILTDYTVGSGIMFQSRIRTPDGKKQDPDKIQKVEDAFNFWADEADFAGQLHYYEMMRLAKRQDSETGEFILIKKRLKNEPGRYIPVPWERFLIPRTYRSILSQRPKRVFSSLQGPFWPLYLLRGKW